MDEVVKWVGAVLLIVAALASVGWFISSGPSWETRRKMNEYPLNTNPRNEDYLRRFMWKGPGKKRGEDWEKLEGDE